MLLRVDLHVHSTASDGRLRPAEVVAAAVEGRLDVIALTDHDTAAGVAEAREAARDLPLRVIPGIEISTRHGDAELHVLGYHVDPASPPIVRHQEESVRRREDRMRRMVERLRGQGIDILYDDVVRVAGPEAEILARPHLARALLEGRHIRTYGEAFERYLRDGASAYVTTDYPAAAEAIGTIHAAGGLAVWAHPPPELFEAEVRALAGLGLDGIECWRPGHDAEYTQLLEAAARELGLLMTGGSDWHGPYRSRLGEFALAGSRVEAVLEPRPRSDRPARGA